MSFIGVDVGSSSVKACAFSEDGMLLAQGNYPLHGSHPQPGVWEQEAGEVWEATRRSLLELMAQVSVKRDPPRALAVSASGRENFFADERGVALTPAVMGADLRGAEFETLPEGETAPEAWCLSAGHLRERMDPVFRLQWWRKYHPDIVDQSRYFLGWHDFLTLKLCGRAATDPSTASRYAIYDLATQSWSSERIQQYAISGKHLPEIPPWATNLGAVSVEVARELNLPSNLQIVLGGHDINCAVVGAGVTEPGEACLISGSYENVLVMSRQLPTATMLIRGLSVMPHPGAAGYSILAVCPTGNAVLNWTRNMVHMSIDEAESKLEKAVRDPGPIIALPYLSGSMTYWQDGRNARGALIGMTLATTPLQVVQAFMESIAFDHVNTFSLLKQEGVKIDRIRAVGGGARSRWWTQLKADLTGIPIEVIEQQEAGTLGAAILAGVGIGFYSDLNAVSKAFSGTQHVYEPDPRRGARYQDRLAEFNNLVPLLLNHAFMGGD